jgi:hypothetical protein
MKDARRQYFYAVRRLKRKENQLRNEKLASALGANRNRDFFNEIKRINRTPTQPKCAINGYTDPKDIVNVFACKYKDLYNRAPSDTDCMSLIRESISSSLNSGDNHETFISVDAVKTAIRKLKEEKNDGNCGYVSSHLIHASDNYHCEIAKLLSSMFIHGFHPDLLVSATLISIPKDYKGDLTSDSNYRGIALSNSISKLFDIIFIMRNNDLLNTSQLQFAFKPKLSTTMCTTVLKEVVKYYMNNKSVVYSCLLDASKAFDLVRHDKLFLLLHDRKIPALDLRILLNQYNRQRIRTYWQDTASDYFDTTNGIRQGSIASPILFNVYLDELLQRLESSGIGCWVGHRYYGVIAY